jgi:CBS domain-containing protein
MLQRRFGALPVVSDGKVVGIITETDLLRHYVSQAEKETEPRRKRSGKK